MANYIGYFKSLSGINYSVKLISNPSVQTFTEILLSGEEPFVVKYNDSNTPFDAVRTSTATISIVHNTYLEDILSPYAQGTQVILTNTTTNSVEWVGYLTPKLYNQDYEQEYENIELEAADCVSSLQYIDYTDTNNRGVVSFKSIIAQICNSCGLLDGFYWTRSKKVGNTILLPEHLSVCEQNFYSNDTDEPMKLSEILEEICKYVGFTCLQWQKRLYFIDYQYLGENERLYVSYFSKSSNYGSNTISYLDNKITITANSYKENGASISFEPIYNKVCVNDNMYNCEEFIPNIFDDAELTNRNGEFYENFEVIPPTPNCPQYPYGTSWFSQKYKDDADDTKNRYFYRLYDSKNWESVYRNSYGTEVSLTDNELKSVACTKDYAGGTIVDLGVVKKVYLSDYYQYIIPNKLDYTRYLCISQKGIGNFGSNCGLPVFRLKDGYKSRCMLSSNSFLVITFNMIFERYLNRAYINPDWTKELCKGGGTYTQYATDGTLYFKLKIGNKYWNGTSWTTNESFFGVVTERTTDDVGSWNEEKKVLNNVSWDLFVNESGYKIPLSDVDTTQEIQFEIEFPSLQYILNSSSQWNAYCWIKDLSIKAVQAEQDAEVEDSDIIYENVIDEDAVNEFSDISLKLTTYTNMTEPSYSNVIYTNGSNVFLSAITENAISGVAQKPEENIIEKYVNQYSTQTKKLNMTLGIENKPFQMVVGADVDKPSNKFVELGTMIDYQYDRQTITYVEKK